MTRRRPAALVHAPRVAGGFATVDRGSLDFLAAARAVIAAKASKHTRSAYASDLARWRGFCERHRADPATATLPLTTAYRDALAGELSNESIRRALAAMSSIYHTLLRAGAVRANPFHPDALTWPTATALPKARLVTDPQALAMIDHARSDLDPRRGARDEAILRLLYDTGLRRSSVATLERATYRDGSIQAVVKGGKEAELVLPPACMAAVDRWLVLAPAASHLFPGDRPGTSIRPATINKIIKRRADAVGASHVHPHSFRAAFVTAGYDAELPEHEIQSSVHHADPSITKRYDRRARGRMVATQVAAFRGRGKL